MAYLSLSISLLFIMIKSLLFSLFLLIALHTVYACHAECITAGFKISYSKVTECCTTHGGGSMLFDGGGKYPQHRCTLTNNNPAPFTQCVKDLGFATVVNCETDLV